MDTAFSPAFQRFVAASGAAGLLLVALLAPEYVMYLLPAAVGEQYGLVRRPLLTAEARALQAAVRGLRRRLPDRLAYAPHFRQALLRTQTEAFAPGQAVST